MHSWICLHSGTYCMHSGTFGMHSGTFLKAYVTACKLTYSFALHLFPVLYCYVVSCTVLYCPVLSCTVLYCPVLCCTVLYWFCLCAFLRISTWGTDRRTDGQTDIRTCWAASSQLKNPISHFHPDRSMQDHILKKTPISHFHPDRYNWQMWPYFKELACCFRLIWPYKPIRGNWFSVLTVLVFVLEKSIWFKLASL